MYGRWRIWLCKERDTPKVESENGNHTQCSTINVYIYREICSRSSIITSSSSSSFFFFHLLLFLGAFYRLFEMLRGWYSWWILIPFQSVPVTRVCCLFVASKIVVILPCWTNDDDNDDGNGNGNIFYLNLIQVFCLWLPIEDVVQRKESGKRKKICIENQCKRWH